MEGVRSQEMGEWTLNIMYEQEGGNSIFTKERLLKIQETETYVKERPAYTLTCLAASTQDTSCHPDTLLSPLSMFSHLGSVESLTQAQIDTRV